MKFNNLTKCCSMKMSDKPIVCINVFAQSFVTCLVTLVVVIRFTQQNRHYTNNCTTQCAYNVYLSHSILLLTFQIDSKYNYTGNSSTFLVVIFPIHMSLSLKTAGRMSLQIV